MARNKPVLLIDFDGVIHSYTSGWQGATVIADPPTPGALRWLWRATEWFDVQIYSSRSKTEAGRTAMMAWMCVHSVSEFGPDHPMCGHQDPDFIYPIKFAHEKPAAFLTIDDRALTFEGDWSEFEPADLLDFRPWNKRPKPVPLDPYDDGRKRGTSKLAYDKEKRAIIGGGYEIKPETDVPLA
jgi:hypothetical protein